MAFLDTKPVTLRSPFNGEVITLSVSKETLRVLLLAGFEQLDDRSKRVRRDVEEEPVHG